MPRRLLSLAGLAVLLASAAATADDKDLLKRPGAPPNLLIVFGNSQTTEQPIQGSTSAWDGDADSPASKMGAAKRVLRQFTGQSHSRFNIGMTSFAHNPNAGSITLHGKHWLYSPLTEDFPAESWKEPAGTIERWGPEGEGPCTNLTSSRCTDRSLSVALPSGVAGAIGPFFGFPAAQAFVYLNGTVDNKGAPKNATKRIKVTLTAGRYGDAFTDGTLSTYTIGNHSMEVLKVYEELSGNKWAEPASGLTPGGSPSHVTIHYVPSSTLTSDLFYTTKPGDINAPCVAGDPDCGKEIGFLNDPQGDVDVNANCSGWEFQSNSNPQPLIKIPHDYNWGATCKPPQDSLPCVNRLLRPQARLVAYNQATGAFTTNDPDNPGYTDAAGNKYADGCNSTLMGAVDSGLDITENQAIMITRNGSQAPIKNLLVNILDYFTRSSIDGFTNGIRADDPDKSCRVSAVVLIYDNFNGCQNDDCRALTNQALAQLKQIGIKVFVIGFGKGVGPCVNDTCAGYCIAQNTAAFQADGTTVGYFPVSDADGLLQVLNDIASILDAATQTFATAAVSTTQTLGSQMAYFASFNAARSRSIWNGRLGGYKLLNGSVQLAPYTVRDAADAANLVAIQVPSNASGSLMWNAGANLLQTRGTGATVPGDILAPGDAIHRGTYTDDSNDVVNTAAPTNYYFGRKIVFSLPQGYASPVTALPIPAGDKVPENRYDMTYDTSNVKFKWSDLKALIGPQTSPPNVLSPALGDDDAGNSLRFIWGDRDAVTGATVGSKKYCDSSGTSCQKLGDLFHSTPLLVGNPNDFALFKSNSQDYKTFFNTYKNRRRVLYVGANDGLLHAFDAGVVGRDAALPADYDSGTGAELFAFAPRSVMQIFKPLKDAVGPQTKQNEWTVDLSPSAADVFIDADHNGTPVPGDRAWHTVLVGGVREGSPFEGTNGAAPRHSQGSYYALDITQPDELVGGIEGPPGPGNFTAPKCLNVSGDATCTRDWPTVLWEITDRSDLDAPGSPGAGYPDMGETWAKASMGRVKVCISDCGTSSAVTEDHYVTIFGGGFDRERKNRRGNWLYMVDIETGKALFKVNSSCGGDPPAGGCTPTYFGSIPSEPAALDYNDDGYLDLIYVGDLRGQLWRIDLTDLRQLTTPQIGSFRNQLDLVNGTGRPFLFFQAGPATPPVASAFYPIYSRPEAINLGYLTGGRPALGIAFGTGDRDDILATLDPLTVATSTPTYTQRFYYVIDAANTQTVTESTSGMLDIASPTAAPATSAPARGWFLELIHGERVVGDSLAPGGVIRFPAYNPYVAPAGTGSCGNAGKCANLAGTSRLYQVYYNTGNAYLGATDRGETQPFAMFITAETAYLSGGSDASGIYWSGGVQNPTLGIGKKITVRSWKESTRRP